MTQSYVPNSEWHYDSGFVTPVVLPLCCPMSTYHMIQFHMKFTRLRPFYIINLIVPSVLFSLLMLLTFLLPTESGERFGYSLTILLSYTVLLTISTDMMPTTSKQIPVISKNIGLCFFMQIYSYSSRSALTTRIRCLSIH